MRPLRIRRDRSSCERRDRRPRSSSKMVIVLAAVSWRSALAHEREAVPSSSATMRSRRRARSRLWVAISAARPVLADDLDQRRHDALAGGVVEIAGRLVGRAGFSGRWRARGRSRRAAARRPTAAPAGGRAARPSPTRSSSIRGLAPRAGARATAGDHLRQHDVFERREFRQQMMELIDEAERAAAQQRAPLVGQAAAIRARRSAPRRHPGRSSSPATCSSVDFPAPDGPTSATISPGCSARSTPFSTASSIPPCRNTRAHARAAPAPERRPASPRLIRSAAPRPDRAAPPATTGRASRETTAPAP